MMLYFTIFLLLKKGNLIAGRLDTPQRVKSKKFGNIRKVFDIFKPCLVHDKINFKVINNIIY